MPHRNHWIALGALGTALLAQPVWAQGTAPSLAVTPTQAMADAALLEVPDASSETLAAATFGLDAVQSGRREGTILMIVGGAAFIVGLIAEEEVVWIPGLAVGLFGLYRYLKSGGDI